MKILKLLAIAAAVCSLSACAPRIVTSLNKEYAPLDYREEVLVIPLDQPEPEQAEVLGKAYTGLTFLSV